MKREEAIKTIMSATVWTDEEREALGTLIPELRESEDEKVKERAIAILKQQRDYWSYDGPANKFPPSTKRKDLVEAIDVALAYLEKQKDLDKMIVVSPDVWDNAINDAYGNGKKDSEKQKEHQNNSDAREKALGRYLTFPLDKDKNLDDIAQDYVDRVKEYNPEPTWDLMQTAVCYGYHYCEQKEQKPLKVGENAYYDPNTEMWFIKKEQKPAEWSEEDENMIRSILDNLRRYQLSMPNFQVESQMRWLKSLRPVSKESLQSWKPSEEQMEALQRASTNEYLSAKQFDILVSLYEQLKKLKEE